MVVRLFSPSGGLELYTHQLVEGLLQKGFLVTVICEQCNSPLIHPNLQVKHFPQASQRLSKADRLNHYLKASTKAVADFGPFDLIHSQHFPVHNPDLVTIHNHTVGWLAKCGKPWEQMVNSAKQSLSSAYKARQVMDKLLYLESAVMIFPSIVCRDDFQTQFDHIRHADPASHIVAYPGVQLKEEESSSVSGVRDYISTAKNSGLVTFLFVGRGFRKKGLDILLAACSNLRRRGYTFQLHIAGLKEKILDKLRLRVLGLSTYVTYLGFRKDMQDVYSESQALILPSRVEPFGMVALEALAYGVIPIVSKVSGVAEILTDRKNALILKDHLNPKKLADLMAELIEHPRLRDNLKAKAKFKVLEHGWNKTIDATIGAYTWALNKKQGNK